MSLPRKIDVAVGVAAVVALFTLVSPFARATVGRGQDVAPAAGVVRARPQRMNAFVRAAERRLDHLPGEVVVKFKAGTSTAGRLRALGALRARPTLSDLEWTGDVGRFVDPDDTDPAVMVQALARQPEVEFAQPNYIRRLPHTVGPISLPVEVGARTSGVPNDPDYALLQWNMPMVEAPGAWDISPGGVNSVVVAVVDTGLTTATTTMTRALWTGQRFEQVLLRFDRSPDLSPSRVVLPRDIAFEPGGLPLDYDGHGTHVASTIAEDSNNLVALAGLAYNVSIMPVKVCIGYWELMLQRAASGAPGFLPVDAGECADDDIAAGVRYAADNGARVINLSLGGPGVSPLVRDAIVYAIGRGAFVAVAMGNEFESGNAVDYPAGYAAGIEGLMSVGAVGKSRARAYYSSTGAHLEVVAPGGSDHDGTNAADGGYVWQVTLMPNDVDPLKTSLPRFDRYREVGYLGTSMSTPHVSALAALLASRGITSPKAIEAAIKASALDLGTKGRDNEYGVGLMQARRALFGLGVVR